MPIADGCDSPRGPETHGKASSTSTKTDAVLPSVFVAHGSPLLLDDATWVDELRRWGAALPRPEAILVVSAHWLDAPVALSATSTIPLVYDFYGFPAKYYDVVYPAPGAPELAKRVRSALSPSIRAVEDSRRGLDHGTYVPLKAMWPNADVPVLQMSIPTMDPKALLALGRALAPLRREGVLIMSSGFLTHNMRAIDWRPDAVAPGWASEFDAWIGETLAARDLDALVAYRDRAPAVHLAHPTHEHFVPVLVAAGAAFPAASEVAFPITGFTYGSFTKRSVQFG